MENLDKLCAEYGHKFATDVSEAFKKDANPDPIKAENLLTKALGVLQEQGLYAFVLFCESTGSSEKPGADKMKVITKEILKDKLNLISNDDLLKEIRNDNGLASRLDDLTLAIQVLEKSLIYARYHAKAMAKSSAQTATSGESTT